MQQIDEIARNCKFINKKGEEQQINLKAIPNNMGKCMAFTLGYNLVFIDSFHFISSSLDKLVINLPREALKYTSEVLKVKHSI